MTLLSRTPYTPPTYAEMAQRNALMEGTTEASYATSVANLQALKGAEVSSIAYESDGLRITGIEVLPELRPGERVPLMIYNRGGSGDYGMLSPGQVMALMAPFAKRLNCAVLASNYRGNGDSEGREEFGGADVRDVLRLIEIGQAREWWDGKNLFMLGWSRGGMMTYLTMKAGVELTAAVVGAGLTNLFASAERHADMEPMYARRIADYAAKRDALLRERSAIHWPKKITAPLLMLHGDADARIEVDQPRALYAALQKLGREVRYVEYPDGDHALRKQWLEWVPEAAQWFEKYRK